MAGTFDYDLNGNLLRGAGKELTWFDFDMPNTITKNGITSTFVYGPEHQRVRQQRTGLTVVYAGVQESETRAAGVTVKTYWPGGIGMEIDKPDGTTELVWSHTDRLGSVVALSDQTGALKERLAYDAWGKRRSTDGSATPDTLDGETDSTGFTGHEMLDAQDMIHMNGRVYDPLTARFASADPFLQSPTEGGSHNRYSYVMNNPTNFVDPSGYEQIVNVVGQLLPSNASMAPSLMLPVLSGVAQEHSAPAPVPAVTVVGTRASRSKNAVFTERRTHSVLADGTVRIVHTGSWKDEPPAPSRYDKFSKWAHIGLSGLGTIPALGIIPDGVDWLYTAGEMPFGKSSGVDLALATAGLAGTLAPVVGDGAAAAAKIAARAGKQADVAGEAAKLSKEAKNQLRSEATDIWQKLTGRRAIWDGMQVHHRVPLEYAHLFPGVDPNRVANLMGVDPKIHSQITNAWNAWGRSLGGRVPTRAEVIGQAIKIDSMFGAHLKAVR
ncbi:RHS repeat domain-containing protein [Pseudoduganella armeniaca]|uniref:RHS repeat-associated core domain-containing protein n=1 Tax=Pseudoduganella armeniaca TaxID=2072590 RepID=A0A2R4C653_9BURK|nr:RHS repeat-associated core domain-containing protein [Pseudoduganella armeniaca]AVR95084.1 hypothetical protein C9I28_04635 [Pseudoduganella armeniaca]